MKKMTEGLEWFLSHYKLFSIVMTVVSVFTSRTFNAPLSRFDSEYVAYCLGLFSLFHTLVGNQIYEGRLKKNEVLRIAILRRDLASFLVYRDSRIHPALTFWLRSLSILTVLGALFAPFENHWLGTPFVWGVFYLISSFWATVIELDDPFKGEWNLIVPNTPEYEKWMTIDPQVFFSLPKNQKAPVMSA